MKPTKLLIKQKNKKVKFDDLALISTEDRTPPVIIAKSDGSFLYMTTDLGTVVFRENKKIYDKYIYVVDFRQKEHFLNYLVQLNILNYQTKISSMSDMEL